MLSRDASIGLVTLNAKYVHLALSLRYLRNAARAAGFDRVWLGEYTVQLPLWKLAAEIQAHRPALLGFSVYIWNREPTLALIELVKQQSPETAIVVGGPEVSFEPGPPTPFVDYVIAGEGERKWVELLETLARGERPSDEQRRRWAVHGSDLPALDALPYREADLGELERRLVYLETSRGCPYRCSFCLSALDETVRYYDDAAVKAHIELLIARGARRIKFLDRTFNLRKRQVLELFAWLMRFEGVEFHFEVVGDLLDEELLAMLERAPAGMFQFEVGIQTAEAEALARIDRRQKTERLFAALRRLRAAGRVHLHADLIWGLPGETLADIRRSFEAAIALRPHELQLGFLKFLPGAPIRRQIEPEGYVFQQRPPYEVIAHRRLPAADVLYLKRFEEVFDAFYNSGRFRFTLERLFAALGPWAVFERLVALYDERELWLPAHSLDTRFGHLLAAFGDGLPDGDPGREALLDLLRLDYFFHQRAHRIPEFLRDPALEAPGRPARGRRLDRDTALVPFRHRLEIGDGAAGLRDGAAPVWYAFSYPRDGHGYFFHPTVREVG